MKNKGLAISTALLAVLVLLMGSYIFWLSRPRGSETAELQQEIDYSRLLNMGGGIFTQQVAVEHYTSDGTREALIQLRVQSDGKVSYVVQEDGTAGELQTVDVTRLISCRLPGMMDNFVYILDKDGRLYCITVRDILEGKTAPELVQDLPVFVDIGIWNTYKPNAGGGTGVYGVTPEGVAIPVVFEGI